jgi:L-ectoine synthase
MIVRSLKDISGTEFDVSGPGWISRRLLVAQDGLGYSLHDTVVLAGSELRLEYKHHYEACYCIAGRGTVTALADGIAHELRPFTVYALEQNDPHTVRAYEDLRLICVFNPALGGREVHREDGSYAPPED